MSDPITTQIGDSVYLKTVTANLHFYGQVSDLDSPDMVSATLDVFGDNGVLSLSALMGPQGPPGSNAPLPKLQLDTIHDPDDLPQNLINSDVDNGKYWIIEDHDEDGNAVGSKAYMWNEDHYQVFMMGSPGPVGPVPVITPNVVLLDPDDDSISSHITVTGDNSHPSWTLYLKAPRGPEGPAASIESASDTDFTNPPAKGDLLIFDGDKWKPGSVDTYVPKFYTMPSTSFTSAQGISTRLPIGSFAIPAQPWPWVPIVNGHIRAVGLELDSDPLILGCEVRLGNQTSGQVVARGYGNISTWTTITPQFSSEGDPGGAASPSNTKGVVPANHTGNEGTLYVNLFNDGVTGAYVYNKDGSQLSILVLPAIYANL